MPMKTGRLFAMVVVGVLAFAAWSCKPENEEVENVTVNPSEARLEVGGTYQLMAVVMPLDAPKEFQWTSSNSLVATVSGTGLVTAVAIGECNITVTAGDKSDVCRVTVVERGGGADDPQGPDNPNGPDNPEGGSVDTIGFDANGASIAVFSVADGRTVRFSRGNLQYQASTDTWRFAERQYDYIGNGNSNISSSYNGWIDLFGWGTSGWKNSGATAYEPWSTSTEYGDYFPGGDNVANLTDAYANADWGVYNAISNGGNQAGMWRTLTKAEWEYLLYDRDVPYRHVKATLNGTDGLIVFPDDFTMPAGITFFSINITTMLGIGANTINLTQWNALKEAGCIFLPAAGLRIGTDVSYAGTSAYYWTSSCYMYYAAWYLFVSCGFQMYDLGRSKGLSVRLVQDVD